jgi:ATP-binding cassette subfamily F protein uup
MNILSAENLTKSYCEKNLFIDASIGIDEGEKIGVIGINGTGKSTLLKILAGIESADTGKIIKGNRTAIEYLPQNPAFDSNISVLRQIFKVDSPVMNLLREYENALHSLEANPGDEIMTSQIISLTQRMDQMKAWGIESEVKTILTKLGINDFDAIVGTLSGGQRKRIALASALINPSDILILDEPTNQLDNMTIDWLENHLINFQGAILMVTHDRYFLQRVCNRIVEIDSGRLYSYQSGYEKYLELKAKREESELGSQRKQKSLLRKELDWMNQGPKARSTKQRARIERFEQLNQIKQPSNDQGIEINTGMTRLGKKIIELEHVGKDYNGIKYIDDLNYNILRDDRIGIIGANGIGKSTLLKIIAGDLQPDRGNVNIGDTVKIGFFRQENEDIDESMRVIEYIRSQAEYITNDDGQISAAKMLEKFLFPPTTHWQSISKLSGGEKRRLYLLIILMSAPNVILLDEPTNDLDIMTLTILESYLNDFKGAVIVISHDRYFLDRVADNLFIFEGDAVINRYQGNYSDYYEAKKEESLLKREDMVKEQRNDLKEKERDEKKVKFSYKEQKEFDAIDVTILNIENQIALTSAEILQASSDYVRLQELFDQKEKLEETLYRAMERWVYLNELHESFQ